MTRPTIVALLGAVSATALPTSAGTAHADTQDDRFLALVPAQSIPGAPDQLVAAGHAACDNYGSTDLAVPMTSLMAQGLSNVQASNVHLDGINSYCPEKAGGMPLP